MNVDNYLFRVPADFVKDQGWVDVEFDPNDAGEIHYWRRCVVILQWMAARYRVLGGSKQNFAGSNIRIFEHDCEAIIRFLKSDAEQNASGFFFGGYDEAMKDYDIEFFENFLTEANFTKYAYLFVASE